MRKHRTHMVPLKNIIHAITIVHFKRDRGAKPEMLFEPISKIRLVFRNSKLSFAKSRESGARRGEKAEYIRSM
jgi:hypothetical protein